MKTIHCFKIFLQVEYLCTLLQGQVTLSDAITLTSENVHDGHWEITEGAAVTLVCTNYPYTGVHIWKYDFMSVAECNITSCEEHISKLKTDLGLFTFENDTKNGVFRWVINPVKTHYDGKVFKCSDGTEALRLTARVTACDCDSCRKCRVFCGIILAATICLVILRLVTSFHILAGHETPFSDAVDYGINKGVYLFLRDGMVVVIAAGAGTYWIRVHHADCDSCMACSHCFSVSVGSIVMGVLAAIISVSIYITKKTASTICNTKTANDNAATAQSERLRNECQQIADEINMLLEDPPLD